MTAVDAASAGGACAATDSAPAVRTTPAASDMVLHRFAIPGMASLPSFTCVLECRTASAAPEFGAACGWSDFYADDPKQSRQELSESGITRPAACRNISNSN